MPSPNTSPRNRPDITDEEVDKTRADIQADIDSGRLAVKSSWDAEVKNQVGPARQGALMLAAQIVWTVMRAPASCEFIICDHPVSIYNSQGGT